MATTGEVRVGRRVFLGLVGLGAAGIVFGAKAQDWLERVVAPVISKDGTGLSALLPIGRFRIYTVTGDLPSRSAGEYRLTVSGLVDNALDLGFDDLRAMTPVSLTRDFQCVTGWRVSDVQWKGVLLRDVLDRAGVQPEATALQFTSFDGVYTESLTMEQARRDDVIVAYEMEGSGVSREHGGPVRMYVAPMYGYKSLKWLEGIYVVDEVRPGYWEQLGYDVDGWVGKSNNRDDPRDVNSRVTGARVPRFDRAERIVHWSSATLFLVLIATGAALYAGPISTLVGRRELMRNIHVYSGLLLPVPILVGLALPFGKQLRADAGRISRWDRRDRGWWRPSRRAGVELGKFNPGQKLNATFVGASIVVMLATGSIMHWFEHFSDDWRTGATFVHDWFALGVGLSAAGHIAFALSDPDALRGMVRGWVPRSWAKAKRPRWYAELEEGSGDLGDAAGDVVARAE